MVKQNEAPSSGELVAGETKVGCDKPISKNQIKKLARRQKMLEGRKERRRIEKEKKKRKRMELRKMREENQGDQQVEPLVKRIHTMAESDNRFRIVIDMDFEEYMTDDEIGKSAKQVGRIYSLNRHSPRPCQLYLSSLKGRIKDRFSITNAGYQNWDVNISDEDYLEIFKNDKGSQAPDNIIYLTADTEDSLPSSEDLLSDDSKIFIIGGLVDHNRHKSLCFKRAQERQIRTAKLPIKDYVQLCQRHILSTVTVFEILLNVLALRMDWRGAFVASIPKRKLAPSESSAVNEGEKSIIETREVIETSDEQIDANQINEETSDSR